MSKIIALLPVKNEMWVLPTYMYGIRKVVDEVIAIDDQSTDGTYEYLKDNGVTVHRNEEVLSEGWPEYNIRCKLLELGRKAGGTHFLCLDADECFSADFFDSARLYIKSLKPGEKMSVMWAALWGNIHSYKEDNSVWSRNFKDFAFCDRPDYNHEYAFLGVGRTPGPNNEDTLFTVPFSDGVCLHYQFASWNRFHLKQMWYRMSEVMKGVPISEINAKYDITLDDKFLGVLPTPEKWLKDIPCPTIESTLDLSKDWRTQKIKEWIMYNGINKFASLHGRWDIITEILNYS